MKTLWTTAFTIFAWYGLIDASSAAPPNLAENSLEGHRLFFTEAERTDATLKAHGVASGSVPKATLQELATSEKTRVSGGGKDAGRVSADPLSSGQGRASAPPQEGSSNDYHVYFTGLVSGMHEARILVNGLPCESVFVEHNVKADQLVPINCHGVRDDELRLAVSILTEALLVTDPAGQVHHLSPGEGM